MSERGPVFDTGELLLILLAWVLFGIVFMYFCYRAVQRHQQPRDIPALESERR